MRHPLIAGALAGAAGTSALNALTYLDMTARGRPSSELPADAAEKLTKEAGVPLGAGKEKDARQQALGALLGIATGVGVGAAFGLLRHRWPLPTPVAALLLGGAAMAGSDLPMTGLGLTDPRGWPPSSWAADAIPHLGYGIATAAALSLFADES